MLAVKHGSEQDVTRGGGNGSGCSGTCRAVMNSALCARKKQNPRLHSGRVYKQINLLIP